MRAFNRILSVLIAAAILVAGVLIVIEVVAAVTSSDPVLVKWHGFTDALARNQWKTAGPRVAAIVLILVGLLLLLFGLRRGKPANLQLVSNTPGVEVTTTRRSVQRSLASSATSVDGVADAKVTVKRRKIKISAGAASASGAEDVKDRLQQRLEERINRLSLVRDPRVKVKLSVPADNKTPEAPGGLTDSADHSSYGSAGSAGISGGGTRSGATDPYVAAVQASRRQPIGSQQESGQQESGQQESGQQESGQQESGQQEPGQGGQL